MSFPLGKPKTTVEIPQDLLNELSDESVVIAQHGYTHTPNLTQSEMIVGYELLVSQGLESKYYISPYEEEVIHPLLPVMWIPWEYEDVRLPWNESAFGIDNFGNTVIALHIQDDVENGMPEEIFERAEIVRVDDINTDAIPIELQVERIRILKDYCQKNNKILLLAVIPYVPRVVWWYFPVLIYFNILCILWVGFVIPFYAFYFLSIRLLKKEISKIGMKRRIESQIKLSVVMPAYNEEEVIKETTMKNITALKGVHYAEIIVVNDGSTDRTEEIVKDLARQYKEVKLINHSKNMGKYQALNTGIREAKGEMIICSDADSYLSPNAYSVVTSIFEDQGIGAVVGVVESFEKKGILAKCQAIEYLFDCLFLRLVQFVWKNVIGIPGPFFAFRRDDIRIIRPGKVFDDSIVEDFELAILLNAKGFKICPSREVVAYTKTPKSIRSLRKQRIRWFGGTLYETIRYRGWKINPFYTLNLLTMFAAPFMLALIITQIILAALLFGISYLLLLLPFFFVNFAIGTTYALTVKRYPLIAILVFPFYLWLLQLIRFEATLRVLLRRKLRWR